MYKKMKESEDIGLGLHFELWLENDNIDSGRPGHLQINLSDSTDDEVADMIIPIQYCPFCGEELKHSNS